MSDTQVGRITFGTVANPAAWDIGDSSYLTFGSPTEAKRAEELFTAMQRELAAKAEECEAVKLLLGEIYDLYENGDPCHEISGDEMGCYLGNAVRLSNDLENKILAALREAK